MLLTRWNQFETPWLKQVRSVNNEMNRLFQGWGNWRELAAEAAVFPALNVWEHEDAFQVEAELPGLALANLEIFVTGQNQLTIKGARADAAPEKAVQHRQERQFGKFIRTLTLPTRVDDNKIEARLENGVLKIHLPKHESAKPRKIPVKA